jgi:hypothetical protein
MEINEDRTEGARGRAIQREIQCEQQFICLKQTNLASSASTELSSTTTSDQTAPSLGPDTARMSGEGGTGRPKRSGAGALWKAQVEAGFDCTCGAVITKAEKDQEEAVECKNEGCEHKWVTTYHNLSSGPYSRPTSFTRGASLMNHMRKRGGGAKRAVIEQSRRERGGGRCNAGCAA